MRNLLILLLPTLTRAYNWKCNLHCFNGGECLHGKGQFGSYEGIEDEEMPWEKVDHENGMFCSCPVGYTGLQCEIKLVVCGADGTDSHTCFNGSECKKDRSGKGKIFYRCECDKSNSVLEANYAGKYCEHIATSFCNHSKQGPVNIFCTNGGRCKDKDDPSPGHCECLEGWQGEHCEIATSSGYSVQDLVVDATNSKNVGKIVGFVILGVFAVVGVLYCRDKRSKKRTRRRRAQEMTSSAVFNRDSGEIL